jgi:hypothetical protein
MLSTQGAVSCPTAMPLLSIHCLIVLLAMLLPLVGVMGVSTFSIISSPFVLTLKIFGIIPLLLGSGNRCHNSTTLAMGGRLGGFQGKSIWCAGTICSFRLAPVLFETTILCPTISPLLCLGLCPICLDISIN